MTNVMQRCVPVSRGTLGPDLRVNYQFGLVLGVDEFEQEGRYLRERDERIARVGHGIGTATGLHVTLARPTAAPIDLEARVEPGIAVDQFGRWVVVRTAQCARIGAWLAASERDAAANQQPSPLEAHIRPSGDLTLYVVASYSECLDALVPLPGNPCGADDEVMAASRVRDSWNLELRWEPPEMAQWDGVRDLADLLATVDVHDGSLLETDEDALAAAVRALAPGAPSIGPLPAVPVLPRGEARAALDRLLTIWVTEVRPQLDPDLIDPAGEAAVLLSTITIVPAAPFDVDVPAIVAFDAPDDEGRPYLAPTQLIQELVAMGAGGVTTILGSPSLIQPAPELPVLELATVTETTGDPRRLVVWSHLDQPLVLPATVMVSRNGAMAVPFTTSAGPLPGTTVLAAPSPLVDAELLAITLDLTQLRARDVATATETALDVWLPQHGIDLVDRVATTVTLHHVVGLTPPAPAPVPVPTPVSVRTRQVMTATGTVNDTTPFIEVWWHLFKDEQDDEPWVVDHDVDTFGLFAEFDDDRVTHQLKIAEVLRIQHNVYRLQVDADSWAEQKRTRYLRLRADLAAVEMDNGADVRQWLADLGIEPLDTLSGDGRFLVLPIRLLGQNQ